MRSSHGSGGLGWKLILLLSVSVGGACRSHAVDPAMDAPRMLRAQPLQGLMGISFVPGGSHWVVLESSTNLLYWTPVVQVSAQTGSALYVDVDASTYPRRFFRARSPGVEIETVRGAWESAAITSYSYRLERFAQVSPNVTSALVTVRRGVKVISEAVSDGVPMTDPDPTLFPSIPELFEELSKAKEEGIRQVWVTFDVTQPIPVRCTFDRRGGLGETPAALVQYRLSGFTVVTIP